MLSISYLVIFFLAVLLIEVLIFKASLVSPIVIFSSSFFLCSLCSMIMGEEWNLSNINYNTFYAVIVSSIVFIFVDFVFRLFNHKAISFPSRKALNTFVSSRIKIPNFVIYFFILLELFCIVLCLFDISKFASNGSWNSIMSAYKDVINITSDSLGFMRTINNQFNKIITAFVYILMFYFCSNKANGTLPKKSKFIIVFSFCLFFLYRLLLSGSRAGSLSFAFAFLVCFYLCNTFIVHDNKKVSFKYVLLVILIILILLFGFYYLGRFVGRKEEANNTSAFFGYLSTGFYGLEWIVSNNYSSEFFGEISFPSLYPLLKFLGVLPEDAVQQSFLPFFWHGNTVTLIGRWYWDFGINGVIVMSFVVSLIYNSLFYIGIQSNKNMYHKSLDIIIYCMMIYILFFAGYDDYTINLFSLTFLLTLLLLLIFYYFFYFKSNKGLKNE